MQVCIIHTCELVNHEKVKHITRQLQVCLFTNGPALNTIYINNVKHNTDTWVATTGMHIRMYIVWYKSLMQCFGVACH